MKTNVFIFIFFLSVMTLSAQELVLDPIPSMTAHAVVDKLPYTGGELDADWSGKSEPTGWNAMSVNVDFNTGRVSFTYPSLWQYSAKNGCTWVDGTSYNEYMVHALMLPLIKVAAGVTTLKVSYGYKVESKDELESNMVVAFATDGEVNRTIAGTFMDACLANMGAGVNPANQEWNEVTQEFNMADFPSREVNIVLMAMHSTEIPTSFGFKNISVVDPNSVGCTLIESADNNISVSNGQIRITDLASNSQVELISASGTLLSRHSVSGSASMGVAHRGLYLVRITQDGKHSLSKVLIP